MRLIDADVLIRYFKTLQAINSADVLFCEDLEDFIDHIEELPTAYDIDKVVEQLDKLQASETPEWNDGYYSAIYEAISIVKGGAE